MREAKTNQYYYNTDEYREKLSQLEERKAEIDAEMKEEAEAKKRETKLEISRLKKIFTVERCGVENRHFVLSLIERAAFLRVELAHMEKKLQEEGVMDFFTQGLQTMWREHPLSKVHVQYTKNYKDVITKLESYGKQDSSSPKDGSDPTFTSLLRRGQAAREKYGR